MKIEDFTNEISKQARSGQATLYINTREEARVLAALREAGWLLEKSAPLHEATSDKDVAEIAAAVQFAGMDPAKFAKTRVVETAFFVQVYRKLNSLLPATDNEEATRAGHVKTVEHLLNHTGYPLVTWDGITGFKGGGIENNTIDFPTAIQHLIGDTEKTDIIPEKCLIAMKDCHRLLCADETTAHRRALRNVYEDGRLVTASVRRHIIFVQPYMKPHEDIRHCLTMVDFPLPDDEDIDGIITRLQNGLTDRSKAACDPDLRVELISSLRGLDEANIEKMLAYCLVEFAGFRREIECDGVKKKLVSTVRRMRSRQLAVGQGIRIVNPDDEEVKLRGDLSGWERVRELANEVNFCRSEKARKLGIRAPNGFAMAGGPGTGKSLGAKLFAKWIDVPCVILKMGNLKESLVGSSEQNMAVAVATIKALGDCVVFLDEWEKQSSGIVNGANDGNTSSSMLATLLEFAEDPSRKAFLIMAMNRLTAPLESMRAGRVSRFYYVPLPDAVDREEILQLKLAEAGAVIPKGLSQIASDNVTGGLTGAELNEMVQTAVLNRAMAHGDKAPTLDDLRNARSVVTPVTKLNREEVEAMTAFQEGGAISVSKTKAKAAPLHTALKRSIKIDPGNN